MVRKSTGSTQERTEKQGGPEIVQGGSQSCMDYVPPPRLLQPVARAEIPPLKGFKASNIQVISILWTLNLRINCVSHFSLVTKKSKA